MIFDDTHQKRQGLPYEYHPYGLYALYVSSFLELHALKIPKFHPFGLFFFDHSPEYEQDPLPSGCQSPQEQCLQLALLWPLYLYHSKFFQ